MKKYLLRNNNDVIIRCNNKLKYNFDMIMELKRINHQICTFYQALRRDILKIAKLIA